jgi:hypothetical protein
MRFEGPDVEIHLLGKTESLAAYLNQLARGDERFEVAFERDALFARNLEQLEKLARSRRMMDAFAHLREDVFT